MIYLLKTAAVALVLGCAVDAIGEVEAADKSAMKVEVRRAESKPAQGLTEATIAGTTTKVYLHKEAVVTNRDIADARVTRDANNKPAVAITFARGGQQKMLKVTTAHRGKPLAILVDGKVLAAPIVKSKIGEKALITGQFTRAEAEKIARGIKGK